VKQDVVRRVVFIEPVLWQKIKALAAIQNKPLYVIIGEALELMLKEKTE